MSLSTTTKFAPCKGWKHRSATAIGQSLPEDLVGQSIGGVTIGDDGTITIDGVEQTLNVVLTVDESGAASWNVDFGADVMTPSG